MPERRRSTDVQFVKVTGQLDVMSETIDNIHTQVKRTNGTVAENVKEINGLKTWRDRMIGGIAVLCILVIPVLLSIVEEWIH